MAMDPTLASYQRIYLQVRRGAPGRLQMVMTMKRPTGGALVALISQGSIARDGMVLDIVSDPSQDPTLTGPKGDAATIKVGSVTQGAVGSALQITNSGTSAAAVFDFMIPRSRDGVDGASAYQVARAAGYGGTETAWLASLVGATGKSAYQLARDNGYGGTETAWLASLKGADGISPALSIGTVTTLAAGAVATATLTGTPAAPKLNLGIPIGATGPSAIGAPTARTISAATAYQATDKTKPAVVTINVASTAALTLTGGQTHTAELLIGPTAASVTGTATSGTPIARYSNSNTGALSVGLAISTVDGKPITAHLPAGWYFALRIVSGTVTIVSAFDQAVG